MRAATYCHFFPPFPLFFLSGSSLGRQRGRPSVVIPKTRGGGDKGEKGAMHFSSHYRAIEGRREESWEHDELLDARDWGEGKKRKRKKRQKQLRLCLMAPRRRRPRAVSHVRKNPWHIRLRSERRPDPGSHYQTLLSRLPRGTSLPRWIFGAAARWDAGEGFI